MSDNFDEAFPYVAVTTYKPSGTLSMMQSAVKGMHPPLLTGNGYTRSSDSIAAYLAPWYCARCEQRVLHDKDGYRKNRGKPAWVHLGTMSPWCMKTKQHGPKSRFVFPVPSLFTVNELGVLDAESR